MDLESILGNSCAATDANAVSAELRILWSSVASHVVHIALDSRSVSNIIVTWQVVFYLHVSNKSIVWPGHNSVVKQLTLSVIIPFHHRLPFQPDNPYGFAVAILIDLCILCAGTISILSFITIYAGVCLNIKSCIEDIAMSSSQANEKILRHQSIRNDLKQLIIFHIHYYKWDWNPNNFQRLEEHEWLVICFYRIMEMLEVIIRAPIFFQISIFCMQLAVILFTLENVSDFHSSISQAIFV